jgi:transcriptional regulator with XRE-family HTH domain
MTKDETHWRDRIRALEAPIVVIGDRLKELREGKDFSQGDIEKKTGLLRCYISRVENGHTVPSVDTLEKFARALEVPMYQLFYQGDKPPKPPRLPKSKIGDDVAFGHSGKDAELLAKFCRALSKANDSDKKMLLAMAQKMAAGSSRAET